MMRLDIEYARRKNLWFDLQIILKTLPAIASQMLDSRSRSKQRRSEIAPVVPAQRVNQ